MKSARRLTTRTRRPLISLFGAGILSVLVLWALLAMRPNFPKYNGKSVEDWFYGEDRNPGSTPTFFDAKLAFQAMGKECVPFLTEKLRQRESEIHNTYCRFYPLLPDSMKRWFPTGITRDKQKLYAWIHLSNLPYTALMGSEEQLLELSHKTPCDDFLSAEFSLTSRLARCTENLNLKKAYYLRNLNSEDQAIKLRASINLSKLDSQITNSIPILLTAVTNKVALNTWFDRAKHASTPDHFERMIVRQQEQAYEALNRIAPDLTEQYPVTHHPDLPVVKLHGIP